MPLEFQQVIDLFLQYNILVQKTQFKLVISKIFMFQSTFLVPFLPGTLLGVASRSCRVTVYNRSAV